MYGPRDIKPYKISLSHKVKYCMFNLICGNWGQMEDMNIKGGVLAIWKRKGTGVKKR
jgi:hypothetical protein